MPTKSYIQNHPAVGLTKNKLGKHSAMFLINSGQRFMKDNIFIQKAVSQAQPRAMEASTFISFI